MKSFIASQRAANRIFLLLGLLLGPLCVSAQVQCPTIPWEGFTFKQNSHVTVWIDTSASGLKGNQAADVETILNNWSQVSGVIFTPIRTTSGLPQVAGTADHPIWTIGIGAVDPGKNATTATQWVDNFDTNISTHFQNSWLTSASDDMVKDLMGHEIVHPYGEWECDPNQQPLCTQVAANNTNNTWQSPQTCDLNKIANNYNNHASDVPGGGGSGSGTTGGDGNACSGSAPNDTCVCSGGSYACTCDGSPYTCNDGSQSECDGGQWSCPSVSTSQCDGSPECSQGYEGVCVNNSWQCQPDGSSCTDVCDSNCSNYDPCSCDPGSCGGGGGGGGCSDICDPACPNYDLDYCQSGCSCEEGCNFSVPVGPVSEDQQSTNQPTSSTAVMKESVHPLCE